MDKFLKEALDKANAADEIMATMKAVKGDKAMHFTATLVMIYQMHDLFQRTQPPMILSVMHELVMRGLLDALHETVQMTEIDSAECVTAARRIVEKFS